MLLFGRRSWLWRPSRIYLFRDRFCKPRARLGILQKPFDKVVRVRFMFRRNEMPFVSGRSQGSAIG